MVCQDCCHVNFECNYFLKIAGCVLQVAYSSQSVTLFLFVCFFFFNLHSKNRGILQNPSENPPAFREAVLRTLQFYDHFKFCLIVSVAPSGGLDDVTILSMRGEATIQKAM